VNSLAGKGENSKGPQGGIDIYGTAVARRARHLPVLLVRKDLVICIRMCQYH